jgi:hypothetical protein
MQERHGIRDTVVKDKTRTRLTKNPERMDVQDETSGETRRHQWNKEPRLKTATTSEEGEDNWQQHQRMDQKTDAMSGKQNNTRQVSSWRSQS